MSLDLKTIIAITSPIISLVVMFATIFFSRNSARSSQKSILLAEFNTREQLRNRLYLWGGEAVNTLSDACTTLNRLDKTDPEIVKKTNVYLSQLMSLIDRGRWLLPNEEHDKYGINKESAYSGLRQDALDYLVLAYDTIKSLNPDDSKNLKRSEKKLTVIQRNFVCNYPACFSSFFN